MTPQPVIPKIDISIVTVVGLESRDALGVLGFLEHEAGIHLKTLERDGGCRASGQATGLFTHLAHHAADTLVKFFGDWELRDAVHYLLESVEASI